MVTIDGEGKALRAAKVLKCPASCSKRMAGCLAEYLLSLRWLLS